jgi:hypothetical protein
MGMNVLNALLCGGLWILAPRFIRLGRMTICLYQSSLYASISFIFLKRLQFNCVTQKKPDTKVDPLVFIGRSPDSRLCIRGICPISLHGDFSLPGDFSLVYLRLIFILCSLYVFSWFPELWTKWFALPAHWIVVEIWGAQSEPCCNGFGSVSSDLFIFHTLCELVDRCRCVFSHAADPPAYLRSTFHLEVVLGFQIHECACPELLWQRTPDVRGCTTIVVARSVCLRILVSRRVSMPKGSYW